MGLQLASSGGRLLAKSAAALAITLWQKGLICIKDARKAFSILHQRVSGEGVAMMKNLSALGMIAAATIFCAAPLSLHWSQAKTPSLSVDTADARIGRPLTPMSVAGVNRRVHRRAYYGAAAAGAYGYARRCAYWHGGVCHRWY
jgi:hypothetical protein